MGSTPVIQALKQISDHLQSWGVCGWLLEGAGTTSADGRWFLFQGLVRHESNRGCYSESISIQEVKDIYELREVIELSLLSRP